MRRIRPQLAPQETRDTHSPKWREVALLVGYLVICLLSVLTVLLPTTENKEEQTARANQGESDAQSDTTVTKSTK